jgi:hypothetical protein
MRSTIHVVTMCIALTACGGGQRANEPAASEPITHTGPTVAVVPASVTEPAGAVPQRTNLTGAKEKSMGRCPSAIDGAVTRFTPTADGGDLTITSSSNDAVLDIQIIANLHRGMKQPDESKGLHSGNHAGPGTIGYCPIVHKDTKVTVEKIAQGVRVHVAATQADHVAALQKMIMERVDALPDGAH